MPDEELLHLLLHNPEEGCRQLLMQYSGFVLAVVRRRIGTCCLPQEAEELVSDILFEFYQKRAQINLQRGSIRALLATLTMHRCTDWYRRYAAQQAQATQVDAKCLLDICDTAPDPETQYIRKEQCAKLFTMMQQLSEGDRNLLMWKYYFGETAPEIAKRLSIRVGTVEMRISRAKKKLLQLMGGEEDAL